MDWQTFYDFVPGRPTFFPIGWINSHLSETVGNRAAIPYLDLWRSIPPGPRGQPAVPPIPQTLGPSCPSPEPNERLPAEWRGGSRRLDSSPPSRPPPNPPRARR